MKKNNIYSFKLSKNEDAHSLWDNPLYKEDKESARHMPLGFKFRHNRYEYTLFDKCLKEVDVCPFCESVHTFHARQMQLKCKVSNIWRAERNDSGSSSIYKKYDFCLDCQREFLFEYFAYAKRKLSVIERIFGR